MSHIERMQVELSELEVKIDALGAFIGTPVFNSLDTVDKFLLKRQRDVMMEYRGILINRIGRA